MIPATDVLRCTPIELRRRLDGGEPLALLDVREDDERAYCAITVPEAVLDLHIPIGQIPDGLDLLRPLLGRLPLVVYCHHGVRSLAVARWLSDRGLPLVLNLDGGIDAWSLAVDPAVPRY